MSSITGWTRLEPRPRSQEFGVGLQARVADPLWMLTRQWQVGEFKGNDAGSAVAARLEMNVSPINRFQPGKEGSTRPYDPSLLPLETLVEREAVRSTEEVNVRLAAEAGLYFIRLLNEKGLETSYRAEYLAHYPLPEPDDLDVDSHRFLRVMSGRAPDGVALEQDLRAALQASPPTLPETPAIDEADQTDVMTAVQTWLGWWDSLFFEPENEQETWLPERFEYTFKVSASEGDGEVVLAAEEYYTGALDWYAFDVQRDANLGGEAGPGLATTIVQSVVPTGVDFDGMPAPRWWEFEDGRVDFGRVDAAPEDLARLLLLEFALVYGNDWLIIPVEVAVGSLCRVRSLVVTDTFGERIEVPPSNDPPDLAASWGLFYPAEQGRTLTHTTPAADRLFFLPPTLVTNLESAPIEEVLLIRDEMANMAWAIERKVQGPAGRPVDRFEAYQEKLRRQPPSESAPVEGAAVVYTLASSIPDHWIPLVPVHVDDAQRAIALQRGAMLDPLTGQPILARGRFLTPNQRLILEDEEVPRTGVQATRTYQHARWTNGTSLLWIGRRKRPGRGEGSSGLRFDTIEPAE